MKTITYHFIDGTTCPVEVTDEFYAEYEQLEAAEKSNDRKETRRHTSLEYLLEEGAPLAAPEIAHEEAPFDTIENEMLRKALDTLNPKEQELLIKVFFEGWKVTEIAQAEGIPQSSVSMRLTRSYKKIKNFITNFQNL